MIENVKKILKKTIVVIFIIGFFVGIALPIDYEIKRFKSREKSEMNYKQDYGELKLPDAYDCDAPYHPKVIKFDNKWNGYKYWITYTPYPDGDDSKENPHIAVSNDMINWTEPVGLVNPIDGAPSNYQHGKVYNSDSHLVYNYDTDMLECYYRKVDDTVDEMVLYRMTTKDGINWNEKEAVITTKRTELDYVSPTLLYEDHKYKMWYVNKYMVFYVESSDLKNWTEPQKMNITYEDDNLLSWHMDVIHVDDKYQMVMSAFLKGNNRLTMNLYYTESLDNKNWTVAKTILVPSTNYISFDNRGIYRSSLLYDDKNYYLFYSATDKLGDAGIGLKKIGKKIEI